MTAKIKTTIGEVVHMLNKAIEYHRNKMTHARKQGEKIKLGMFKYEYLELPLPAGEYWPIMMTYSPWKDLQGVFNASIDFPADTEMWISVELAGKLSIGNRNF